MVLNAHNFLRDVLFDDRPIRIEAYWHRPIVVIDMTARLGEVIGLLKVSPKYAEDDVIDHDLVLVWGEQRAHHNGRRPLGSALERNSKNGSEERKWALARTSKAKFCR